MTVFQVKEASVKRELPDKGARVLLLSLSENGAEPKQAEEYTKPPIDPPAVGSTVEGDLTWDDQYNQWKFRRKRQGGGFGGGGGGKRDTPETRRSIACQHAQKCAVDLLKLAAEHGEYKPPAKVAELSLQVQAVAKALYLQVMQAERGQQEYGQ